MKRKKSWIVRLLLFVVLFGTMPLPLPAPIAAAEASADTPAPAASASAIPAADQALPRTMWQTAASASGTGSAPAMAIDSSLSTRWTSGAAQAAGMWFQIDTGPGEKTYTRLTMDAGGSANDYPRGYEIRVSDDGVVWSEPVAAAVGSSGQSTVQFQPQTARYVRIVLTKSAGLWWSIHDLNVVGELAPDLVPPTVPGSVTVVSKTDTEVELAWAASSDNIGISEYEIYAGGAAPVGRSPSTTFRVMGLTPQTAYSFTVRAKDLSGNVSPASVPVTVTTEGVISLPIIARYDMEPDASAPSVLVDRSGHGHDGEIPGTASFTEGRAGGKALKLIGIDPVRVNKTTQLDNVSSKLTVTAWIKPDDLNGNLPIVSKRDDNWKGSTFYMRLIGNQLGFTGDYGQSNYNWWYPSSAIVAGQWVHVAVVFEKNAGLTFYVNGEPIGRRDGAEVGKDLLPNDVDMLIGAEWHWDTATRTMKKYGFRGAIDSLRIYAAPLTPGQIKADMNDTISIRPVEAGDFTKPTKWATFRLVRFDMPTGLFTKGSAQIHQNAVRKAGPDAVDWPDITLRIPQADNTVKTVKPFAAGAKYETEILLQRESQSKKYFQQPTDNVLEPGNHWVRGVSWRWGQTYLYNTDRTSRTWVWDHELWTFPVKIAGSESGSVKRVVLKVDGNVIYDSGGNAYDSLTLLLPQNEQGKPYELWVDGRGPVRFDAGLQPIEPGNPKDVPIPVNAAVPGPGPAIAVASLERPETFPNQDAWDRDVAALPVPQPAAPGYVPDRSSIARHVGVDVPRSPETINFVYMTHGMSSGGFYHSEHRSVAARYQDIGTLEQYADYVSRTGYDRVFEFGMFGAADSPNAHENMAEALDRRGVRFGVVPLSDLDTIDMRSPNLAFYSYNLPDFRAPLYRDVQLGLQRLAAYPNMTGVSIGADNSPYLPYWDWTPPIPNRPWGTAYTAFQSGAGQPLSTPIASSLIGSYNRKEHEYYAPAKPFLDYVKRYDDTYRQYGYFARAVSEVDSGYVTTTGSFGSSAGNGARGGFPTGTIDAGPMHERLPVQTAYDWNELDSSKPMHLVALIDRLRSADPGKTTWATQDDFSLFFGKTDRQKAYALALTRGIQAIGTNVLPNDRGPLAKPQTIAEQKELYDWIHRYGGAYAMTEPTPPVGILYVNEQSLLRGVVGGEAPEDDKLLKGSHEGKVTEALFLTHAAGWPSKIVTPDELKRGLPSSIKTILLVGLNDVDDSWRWYDGIAGELQSFVDRGGRLVKDAESVSPVAAVDTGMQIRAYVIQSREDKTNALLDRNADNIAKFRAAMIGAEAPIAVSGDRTIWAIPTRSGDTRYVTVVNQKHDPTPGQTQHLIGQTGALAWNAERPIYDIRKGRKVTVQEATYVDLRTEGFAWYALPPSEPTTPSVSVAKRPDGFYEAFATVNGASPSTGPMTGIPVELTVTHRVSGDTATVYSATGLTAKLPLRDTDAPGVYTVAAKELLSGQTSAVSVEVQTPPAPANTPQAASLHREADIRKFAERTNVPVTVALTAAQRDDPAIAEQAKRLVQWLTQRGRSAKLGLAEPGGVVTGLQDYQSSYVKYPQWKTIESDLVLIGNRSNNVLLLDQARGFLLPNRGADIAPGQAAVGVAKSPFVGEYQALNIVSGDTAGLAAAADRLLQLPPALPDAPQGLTVKRITDTTVELRWAAVGGATEYDVERRESGHAGWNRIGGTPGALTSFADTGLRPDSSYTYRVRAKHAAGNSEYGDELRVVTLRAVGETPLDRTGWTATASSNGGNAKFVLDGNAATRWDTATAQVYGQSYVVDMKADRTFRKIVLDTTGSRYDYPRQYEVYVSTDGVDWGSPVATGGGAAVTPIAFEPRTARYVKIVQTGRAGNYWSIHELTVY
ncbi:discoidin domain-containing protein [Paenibacillus flagellatus]|nr:discoidin domain-containing protein [Paenibacillus flagellatus]